VHIDCVWSAYGPWTSCSASCDGGWQRQERSIVVYPQNNGRNCEGGSFLERVCNTVPCDLVGTFGDKTLGAANTVNAVNNTGKEPAQVSAFNTDVGVEKDQSYGLVEKSAADGQEQTKTA